MKTGKTIWRLMCFLMVMSLMMVSCSPAEEGEEGEQVVVSGGTTTITSGGTTTQTTTQPAQTVDPDKPRYGGTLTLSLTSDVVDFDEVYGFTASPSTLINITNEDLMGGDWARGPAGTGEVTWDIGGADVWEYKTGYLAESWDFSDPLTITWYIRQGVRWGLNPDQEASRLVGGRELTADDVVYSLELYRDNERAWNHSTYPELLDSEIVALDKYTVRVKVSTPLAKNSAITRLGDFSSIIPPEVIETFGDMRDWTRSVGTGGFILKDFVSASSGTLVRNEHYWMKNPCGPGEGDALPYVDGLKYLIIPDTSTREAAFRTGKLDVLQVTWETFPSFIAETPTLQYAKSIYDGGFYTHFNLSSEHYDDINVRRAMMMGINWESIVNDLFGGDAEINTWPVTYNAQYAALFLPWMKLPKPFRNSIRTIRKKPDSFSRMQGIRTVSPPRSSVRIRRNRWTTSLFSRRTGKIST